MSPKKIKFRNILGELSVAKLYGGEHLGVTAPANFDLRKEISKIGKAIGKFYQSSSLQTHQLSIYYCYNWKKIIGGYYASI